MRQINPPISTETSRRRFNITSLEKRLGCNRQTIWRWYKNGTFPKPHYLGQNRLWFEAEVEHWENERMLARDTSATSFYTMSGSSPPEEDNGEGGAK